MSKIADAEANATSLDSLVNDNALVTTLRNGPKPSYQYLVDGWNTEFDALIDNLEVQGDNAIALINADVVTVEAAKNTALTTINGYVSAIDTSKDNAIITIDSYISDVDDSASAAISSINANKVTIENAAANVDVTIAELDSKYKLTAIGVDGAWQSGIDFTAYNQYLVFSGTAYQPKPETSLPYTTGAAPDLDDVQPVAPNTADKIFVDNGGTVQDQLDGREFDTVADAIAFTKIDKLLGNRVYLKDRQAYFDVVLTSSVTPNDFDVIQSSENSLYSYSLEILDVCNVINFGAVDGADSNEAVNEANNKSKALDIPLKIPFGNTFMVNSINGLNNNTIGGGEIAGYVSGVKPTYEELKLEDVTGRANLVNSYWLSSLSFDGGFIGDIKLKDIKITSNPFNSGKITATGCSTLGSQFKSEDGGVTVADDIYSVNSTGVGVHAQNSGISIVDNCVIVGSSNRGLYCQHGGTISAVNAKVYDTGSDAVAILYGGNINVSNSEVDKTSGHGLVINYGGSIEATNAAINDTAQSSVTCESGGAIFVKFASISNSLQSALTTSFEGVINADEIFIDGVAGIALYALGGGEVNAELATITNATGQYIARAIGTGKVNYESPDVTGYSEDLYSPRFNMIGNGAAIITNNGDSSKSGVESNYFSFGIAEDKTISSGSINATKSYHNVDTEGGAATDTLATINGGFEGMRLILNAKNSSRTVTINSSDNIRLDVDKGDFSMSHELDKIELMYNRLGLWCELSRSNNQS